MGQSASPQQPSLTNVVDPVCGMSVQLVIARPAGLTTVHEGTEYGFCGRGCRLEFEDDPATYLSPGHIPTM
jgi:P-type Cu+ transporter